MVSREPPYPPPPRSAPPDMGRRIAEGTAWQALRFAGLILGILLYLSPAGLVVWAAIACLLSEGSSLIVRIPSFFVSTCLALVFTKSWLPRWLPLPRGYVELTADEQPTLIAFMARLAEEIGVPAASRVGVSAGCALGLDARFSILSLLFRPRWRLHVGLWLWHGIGLSEFKAIAIRSFAPLSRGRFGALHYTARRYLEVLAFGRDAIDDLAEGDRGSRFVGGARFARGLFRGTTLPVRMAARLLLWFDDTSAEKLADDLIAVHFAGSDALVHAVFRAEFATATFAQAERELGRAARDGVFTNDLFAHGPDAAEAMRQAHNDYTLGELPSVRRPNAGKYSEVFDPAWKYAMTIWEGFPSGYEREENAKQVFVAAEYDDRPATNLLDGLAALRERLTRGQVQHDGAITLAPETVRRWLATPREEDFPARFAGAFETGRWLDPGSSADRDTALRSSEWDDDRLLAAEPMLYANVGPVVARWQAADKGLRKLLRRTLFRPTNRDLTAADDFRLELGKACKWLAAIDQRAFAIYVHMAARLPDIAAHDAILKRYTSVLRIQGFAADARSNHDRVEAFARRLSKYGSSPPSRLLGFAQTELRRSREEFDSLLDDARRIDDPSISELIGEVKLDEFLHSRTSNAILGTVLEEAEILSDRWEEVGRKSLWLYRQGLAALFALQESIAREFVRLHPATILSGEEIAACAVDEEPAFAEEVAGE